MATIGRLAQPSIARRVRVTLVNGVPTMLKLKALKVTLGRDPPETPVVLPLTSPPKAPGGGTLRASHQRSLQRKENTTKADLLHLKRK